jgi:hypothetical protein
LKNRNLIINDIKAFDVSTEIKELQTVFSQLTYTHVPVKKDGVYIGCISETDAYCFESSKHLSDFQYALEPFFVRETTNWLDILEAFALNKCNIIPVLGDGNTYLGYYELGDIMNLFYETPFLGEAGGIIVVEKGAKDYSFSEICQIVESNDARILGAFVSKMEDDHIQVTIKIGHTGINSIVQTFRRYNYTIISQHEEDKFIDDLKERSDYLDKYLKM